MCVGLPATSLLTRLPARAAALSVKRQEVAEWQQKVDLVTAGDLPAYIEVCVWGWGRDWGQGSD